MRTDGAMRAQKAALGYLCIAGGTALTISELRTTRTLPSDLLPQREPLTCIAPLHLHCNTISLLPPASRSTAEHRQTNTIEHNQALQRASHIIRTQWARPVNASRNPLLWARRTCLTGSTATPKCQRGPLRGLFCQAHCCGAGGSYFSPVLFGYNS